MEHCPTCGVRHAGRAVLPPLPDRPAPGAGDRTGRGQPPAPGPRRARTRRPRGGPQPRPPRLHPPPVLRVAGRAGVGRPGGQRLPGSDPIVARDSNRVRSAATLVTLQPRSAQGDLHVRRARPARAADGRPACGSRSWRFRSPSRVRDELACLRLRATNTRGAEQHGSRAGPVDQLTPVIRAERYASGSTASLSCFEMRALTTCLGGISMASPVAGVATGPRFALLQDELRDAGQRELAAILKAVARTAAATLRRTPARRRA